MTKVYAGADFAAVDKLNLDVITGEIFGLLGPNGAGKTPRIVLAAERGGYDLVDLSVAEPSLETVFIKATGKELRD